MSLRRRRLVHNEKRSKKSLKSRIIMSGAPDSTLLFIIFGLVLFGIIAVFSAGAPEGLDIHGNPSYFLIKHLIAIVIGIVLFIFAYSVDYKYWKKVAEPFAWVIIGLVVLTLVPGIGRTEYGSSRWLVGVPIQPSELCKFACILLISSALVDAKNVFDGKLFKHIAMVVVMVVILLIQPNLSNAVMLFGITTALLLLGGVSFNLLGLISLPAAGLALMKFMQPYQMTRIKGWLDPWADPQGSGYNLIQSYYAISSGGVFGLGYGNSRQKLFWLPFSQTDFIFAVIAEELGFIGCFVLIGLFVGLFLRGFYLSNKCTDNFGRLLGFGITFAIVIQACVNIGVAVGVLPVTGVTLPLISHGGTSVVLSLFMLGVLTNISRKRIRLVNNEEFHAY